MEEPITLYVNTGDLGFTYDTFVHVIDTIERKEPGWDNFSVDFSKLPGGGWAIFSNGDFTKAVANACIIGDKGTKLDGFFDMTTGGFRSMHVQDKLFGDCGNNLRFRVEISGKHLRRVSASIQCAFLLCNFSVSTTPFKEEQEAAAIADEHKRQSLKALFLALGPEFCRSVGEFEGCIQDADFESRFRAVMASVVLGQWTGKLAKFITAYGCDSLLPEEET